jgi:cytochrome c-type biogenesis protein
MSILLSPCHFSSIPLVTGYTSSRGQEGVNRSYWLSLVFGIGIFITIALIGLVTAWAGRMMGDVGPWGNLVVAAVFFVAGLHLMDVISLSWSGTVPKTISRGWTGALVLGLIFGIGLGPCTFAFMAPVLGVAFGVAAANPLQALSLLTAFGIGHCVVIVGAGGGCGHRPEISPRD